MSFSFLKLEPAPLCLVRTMTHPDQRGHFQELYRGRDFVAAGITVDFVQDNHSRSKGGVIRGLHYQSSPGQHKLVWLLRGRTLHIAVDLRPTSRSFGRWCRVELDEERGEALYVPVGFAHGFCTLAPVCDVVYKVSSPYHPSTECTLAYDDPDLGIDWPVREPMVSERDRAGESWAQLRARLVGEKP